MLGCEDRKEEDGAYVEYLVEPDPPLVRGYTTTLMIINLPWYIAIN